MSEKSPSLSNSRIPFLRLTSRQTKWQNRAPLNNWAKGVFQNWGLHPRKVFDCCLNSFKWPPGFGKGSLAAGVTLHHGDDVRVQLPGLAQSYGNSAPPATWVCVKMGGPHFSRAKKTDLEMLLNSARHVYTATGLQAPPSSAWLEGLSSAQS